MKDSMQLALHIKEDEVKAPNEIVQGTLSFTTPGDILISEISVEFTGQSVYSFSPYLISDTEHAREQTFFEQRCTPYSSEKTNPKPLSPAGRHEWAFQFRFPANDKALPPSFAHNTSTSQKLNGVEVISTCYVVYSLSAHLRGIDLPKSCPTATGLYVLWFWPNRYTELPDGTWPKAHRHRIVVPQIDPSIQFQKEETDFFNRLRKKVYNKVSRAQKYASLDLIAHVARYAILGQPLQVSLSISPVNDMLEMPMLTLESVKYDLNSNTRVGHSSGSGRHVFSEVISGRHFKNLATSFPEAGYRIHLHTVAPFNPPLEAGWSDESSKGRRTKGPLCPAFESQLIERTYKLILHVTVSCNKKLQERHFVGGIVRQEVEGDNERSQELPTSDAEVGNRRLT